MTAFDKFCQNGSIDGLVNLGEVAQKAKEARNPNLQYQGKINSYGRINTNIVFSANLINELGWSDLNLIEVHFAPKQKHFFLRKGKAYGSILKINQKTKKGSLNIEHPNPDFFPEMIRTNIPVNNYRVEVGKIVFWLPTDEPWEDINDNTII